ncbi:DNA gyrase subunit A [Sesbania bispinosa]|nr:DNA gyrase subunit A [Sesbania bispinosa]
MGVFMIMLVRDDAMEVERCGGYSWHGGHATKTTKMVTTGALQLRTQWVLLCPTTTIIQVIGRHDKSSQDGNGSVKVMDDNNNDNSNSNNRSDGRVVMMEL